MPSNRNESRLDGKGNFFKKTGRRIRKTGNR